MRAGELREKVIIERPEAVRTPSGAKATRWAPSEPWSAQRLRSDARRVDEAGEHFADHRATFLVRCSVPVAENWRLRHMGGYYYTIVAIDPNRSKGYNSLICERVNE